MRFPGPAAATVALALVAAGCQSGLYSGASDWTRSYVQTEDRVWRAVLDTLAEEGFVLDEVDRESDRIRASGGPSEFYREAVLEIRMRRSGERVHVDVEGRMGVDPGAEFRRLDRLIEGFLETLDANLLGRPETSADPR